jgi:predicted phosphoribosyltransferase
VHAHKLTAPIAPEFAFGAIDEDGEVTLDPASVRELGLDPGQVELARQRAWEPMRARIARSGSARITAWLPRRVVLVDDGLATGLTMLAAVRHARRHGASGVTVAVPCASSEAAELLAPEVERFVCPVVDRAFTAVGAYYEDFTQVSDEELAALLARAPVSAPPGG